MRASLVLIVFLVAGCVTKSPGDATTTPIGDQGPYKDFDRDLPGLSLEAKVAHGAGVHTLAATAANEGESTYYVRGVCYSPWETEFRDEDDEAFLGAEPLAHCEAIGWDEFPPGKSLDFTDEWGEQRWNAGRERLEAADAGTYTWAVLFAAQTSQDSAPDHLRVNFTFAVD